MINSFQILNVFNFSNKLNVKNITENLSNKYTKKDLYASLSIKLFFF